jgi:hypothetical protein
VIFFKQVFRDLYVCIGTRRIGYPAVCVYFRVILDCWESVRLCYDEGGGVFNSHRSRPLGLKSLVLFVYSVCCRIGDNFTINLVVLKTL